jgi:hypothetical protein
VIKNNKLEDKEDKRKTKIIGMLNELNWLRIGPSGRLC